MANEDGSDADNELTRIVRRPGPAKLPINLVATPARPSDAVVISPTPAVSASSAAAPDVKPPVRDVIASAPAEKPRPVMVPPAPVPQAHVPPAAIILRQTPSNPVTPPVAAVPGDKKIAAALTDVPAAQSPAVKPPAATPSVTSIEPVVGWIVVIKGPGRGAARPFVTGRNAIGSAASADIPLDFGDPAIVASGHAYVVYDEEERAFFVEDGKQKVVVRLNGKLLTETMPIKHGDTLRIGATTLRLVALCGPEFDWNDTDDAAEKVEPDDADKPV